MASGKQAGSGPARPHLQSMPFREPGARVRRRQSRQSSPSTRRSAGTALTQPSPACSAHRSPGPSAAGVLPSRFLVTCQVPRRARLPPPRPRCARLPAPAGLSPRCTGRHLRPSRSGRRRAPSRPRTRPQPRQSVLHIRIRAPAAASASRQWPRLHHPIRLARPAQPRHSHLAPCGSRSGSTPDKTSACHPLCVRHGCHLRGIGGMDLLPASETKGILYTS